MSRAVQDGTARRPAGSGTKAGGRELWPRLRGYGDLLRDRAAGTAPEMESAKSLCRRLEGSYRSGTSVLDVGCGAGHYLRSLRGRLDPEVDYTGVDLTVAFLDLGRRVFPDAPMAAADAFALPFPDRSFDLVLCSNLLLHLPPPPGRALAELARVTRERLLIRTPVGERNYVIQEVREPDEVALPTAGVAAAGSHGSAEGPADDLFDAAGGPRSFNYFNLYTEECLTRAARRAAPGSRVHLEPDGCFEAFDNRERTSRTGTRVAGGDQLAGNLILKWSWLEIDRARRA